MMKFTTVLPTFRKNAHNYDSLPGAVCFLSMIRKSSPSLFKINSFWNILDSKLIAAEEKHPIIFNLGDEYVHNKDKILVNACAILKQDVEKILEFIKQYCHQPPLSAKESNYLVNIKKKLQATLLHLSYARTHDVATEEKNPEVVNICTKTNSTPLQLFAIDNHILAASNRHGLCMGYVISWLYQALKLETETSFSQLLKRQDGQGLDEIGSRYLKVWKKYLNPKFYTKQIFAKKTEQELLALFTKKIAKIRPGEPKVLFLYGSRTRHAVGLFYPEEQIGDQDFIDIADSKLGIVRVEKANAANFLIERLRLGNRLIGERYHTATTVTLSCNSKKLNKL